ncbi:MAG TPA: hypothetical protein VHE83_15140 [Mycobacteriales bacterium]|nr:hypothetical protein [Mycobacteriales bacterium]
MRRRRALALGASVALATLSAGPVLAAVPPVPVPLLAHGVTYPAPVPLPPLPNDPRGLALPPSTGAPAAGDPLPDPSPPPRHPHMAPNNRSNLHDDAYQSNVIPGRGPSGAQLTVTSAFLQEECASLTFTRRGQIASVCVGAVGETFDVFDPHSLDLLASYALPTELKLSAGSVTGSSSSATFGGGGYFYLDDKDEAVVPLVDGRVVVLAVSDAAMPTISRVKVYDIKAATQGQSIESVLPDWAGRLWFVTTGGIVGIIDPSGSGAKTLTITTPAGAPVNAGQPEKIGNSFAVDESGGVFVVTEEALYRFDAVDGAPSMTWRAPYEHGTRTKPGEVNHGSGTTPTLIGSASSPGGGLVAILDNADPSMHVDVFPRGKTGSHAAVCSHAILTDHPNANSDENNLISLGRSIWAENNYGQPGPIQVGTTVPGMTRIDLDHAPGRGPGCHVVWDSNAVQVPSVVSKVSAASGLVYTYTLPGTVTTGSPLGWYLTAVDARTGKVAWSHLVGTGPSFNNFYAPVTIGPDGTLYVGTVSGLLAVRGPLTPATAASSPTQGTTHPEPTSPAHPVGPPSTGLAATGAPTPLAAVAVVLLVAAAAARRRTA